MWFWRRPPLTGAERRREIARLEDVRDRMLENAARHVAFRNIFAPAVFVLFVVLAGAGVVTHPAKHPLAAITVYVAMVCFFGRMVWRNWLHPLPKGDPWGYSDTLGYEGDSPRDIQNKIDQLRGQSTSDEK
jgi:hypothetical protein